MDDETVDCPECGAGIGGADLEWSREHESSYELSSRPGHPSCQRCGDEINFDELEYLSREGPLTYYCPSCEAVLGTVSHKSDQVIVYSCPSCNVVLGVEGEIIPR